MTRDRGFTLVELIVILLVASIAASAFVGLMIPQANLFFFLPQRIRVQSTASDLLDILFDGDNSARGLRYATPTTSTNAVTAASGSSLTYTYRGADLVNHTVVLTYNAGNRTVTRQIDGGSTPTIPYYATAASGILTDPAETNFFRYYDSAGAELTGVIPVANIFRVDVPVKVSSGSGAVKGSEGNIRMKSGVEIKDFADLVATI